MHYDVPSRLEDNHCFCCGPGNPHGLHLEFRVEGDELLCDFEPDDRFCGFASVVHGGIQGAVLDEVSVWVVAALRGRLTMTAGLNIRFLRPVRPKSRLVAAARIESESEGHYVVKAELRDREGRIHTTSEATLSLMSMAHFRRFTGAREVPEVWRSLLT